MSNQVSIDFEAFGKHEIILKNIWFVERKFLFFKKHVTKDIYFEGAPHQVKVDFGNKYLKNKGDEIKFKPVELVNDLYNFLKKDERNFWLKKDHLKQQKIYKLFGIVLTIVSNLYTKKKILIQGAKEMESDLFLSELSDFLLKIQTEPSPSLCAKCQSTV